MKNSLFGLLLCVCSGVSLAGSVSISNPVMFVTQFPIAADFATIGSTFANHSGSMQSAGRGGDLYIRYPDGSLRNLTQEAGYGVVGLQDENAIAVRDPHVHWGGQKALFSMVIGAPEQFQYNDYYWQIYEVSGLGQGQTVQISLVPGQPNDYNNITPIYGSDDAIIFTSDMPRSQDRFNYPQYDEYESTPTNTGLWKLKDGQVSLMQHSPSGSFSPFIDQVGRLVFTRWDHLQRDQQASPTNVNGAFNYSREGASAVRIDTVAEVFPEPRPAELDLLQGTNLEGHRINHFFPWQLNQDGTEEETLNHVGRHEFHSYFNRSLNDDPNLIEFIAGVSPRPNQNSILNVFQMDEDPNNTGRFVGVDAPEFATHSAGQLIAFDLPLGADPSLVQVDYLSHESTRNVVDDGDTPPPEHVGFFRDPVTLNDGQLLAVHTAETRRAGNDGTRANPQPRYDFTIKSVTPNGNNDWVPSDRLTSLGNVTISYYDPDVLVSYTGPLWEMSPVEVVSRTVPPMTQEVLLDPEAQVFAEESVDVNAFKAFLRNYQLAVVVMRDVTTRDELDLQQPYNLKVAGSPHQTIGSPGTLYEMSHMQFFQGDQVRGYGGVTNPDPGQRVIAQYLHSANATTQNLPLVGAPPGSTEIYPDGSVAAFVPAGRAMSWQSLSPTGEPVVRERYWITFQPGEIRACGGCHGVNQVDQAGNLPSIIKAEAFRDLLRHWADNYTDLIFAHAFD
ncbi:hypothetical protein [Marinicella meishanensis]|uniref:HzsA-related protein n=1 Tax=Marinicella meishanensis TaxID=2873263 RepID=UPI001CBDE0A7|nr:hypothetical protein [Marinicella sp. NBU2979]